MLSFFRRHYTQMFPPPPDFNPDQLPDLKNKVYIVTGSNTGVGKELSRILYSKNARVYVAARSQEKALKAIDDIRRAAPSSSGDLIFLKLDLADLSTIKASAQEFLSREDKLHVLFNNAGIMIPPEGSTTAQGYELQLGVNNIGTFMFTQLLTPTIVRTAKIEPRNTVRVVWVSSSAVDTMFVPNGGVDMSRIENRMAENKYAKYALSKAGNYLHALELASRYREDGVVSVPVNPGNLDSELWCSMGWLTRRLVAALVLHPPVYGAYSELFAGLSPEVTMERSGDWVGPWGRFVPLRSDLLTLPKSKEEGGRGTARKFWEWTEKQTEPHL